MLKSYKIQDYINTFSPEWICEMPNGCPPDDVLVAFNHIFYRLAILPDSYDENDFKSYAEIDTQRNWGGKDCL